jgi:hypothetical protein
MKYLTLLALLPVWGWAELYIQETKTLDGAWDCKVVETSYGTKTFCIQRLPAPPKQGERMK